jgi:hypothetical protein
MVATMLAPLLHTRTLNLGCAKRSAGMGLRWRRNAAKAMGHESRGFMIAVGKAVKPACRRAASWPCPRWWCRTGKRDNPRSAAKGDGLH